MDKSNSNIDNIFRSGADELRETPSRATWKRLERRLDAHQRRNRLSFRSTLGMVAAISLLLVFVFLFSTISFEQEKPMAADFMPTEIEPITSAVDPEAYKVVEYTIKYRDRMGRTIEEGPESTKLKVRRPN